MSVGTAREARLARGTPLLCAAAAVHMLDTLLAQSLRARLVVFIATFVLAAGGWYAYQHLTIEAFPDPTDTQVQVITLTRASPPRRSSAAISIPLERALNGMPGLIRLRSISLFGLSFVTLTFEDGVDALRRAPAGHGAPARRRAARGRRARARPARDADRRGLPLHARRAGRRSDEAAHAAGLGRAARAAARARRRRRRVATAGSSRRSTSSPTRARWPRSASCSTTSSTALHEGVAPTPRGGYVERGDRAVRDPQRSACSSASTTSSRCASAIHDGMPVLRQGRRRPSTRATRRARAWSRAATTGRGGGHRADAPRREPVGRARRRCATAIDELQRTRCRRRRQDRRRSTTAPSSSTPRSRPCSTTCSRARCWSRSCCSSSCSSLRASLDRRARDPAVARRVVHLPAHARDVAPTCCRWARSTSGSSSTARSSSSSTSSQPRRRRRVPAHDEPQRDRDDLPRGARGRAPDAVLAADHHRRLPADLRARSGSRAGSSRRWRNTVVSALVGALLVSFTLVPVLCVLRAAQARSVTRVAGAALARARLYEPMLQARDGATRRRC